MGHQSLRASIPKKFSEGVADDLLYGFDVDEESRPFLTSLIANSTTPRHEIERLYNISLMSGADNWNMLIECATSLRDQICSHRFGPQLTPYLAVVQLQRFGRWSWPKVDPEQKTAPESQSRRRRKSAEYKVITPLKRQQRTSHFFNNEAGRSSATQSPQTTSSKDTASSNTNPEPARRAVGSVGRESAQKRRRSTSETSTFSEKRRSTAKRSGGQPVETPTAGHFNPPPIDKYDSQREPDKSTGEPTQAGASEMAKHETPRRQGLRRTTSHFFEVTSGTKSVTASPSPGKRKAGRAPRGILSALPIPPLSATRFGLIQEELADDPFRLLIAITFLIRTAGRAAIPVYRELMSRYPTPEALAAAGSEDIIPLIHHLGLSSNRCATILKYARIWLDCPPVRDVRYGVKNYPCPGDARDVRLREEFGAEDDSVSWELEANDLLGAETGPKTKARGFGTSWEIGHLTQGPYALDSWRIFCRDALLGRAEDWKGKGRSPDFQPEWMRVLPQDKELRACLRWMWMKEGWSWNPLTGEREVLSEEMRRAVDEGRVAYNNQGELEISGTEGEALDASP